VVLLMSLYLDATLHVGGIEEKEEEEENASSIFGSFIYRVTSPVI